MSYRTATIYVNYKTISRLRLIAKLLSTQSADEIADSLLNEIIDEKYPELKRLERAWDNSEKEYIKEIQQRLVNTVEELHGRNTEATEGN